ncbi:MAG: polyamine aminopropyltransferase [Thermoflexales bacterium]|nr:polyamine aminopropyltransferase [Thermoflexales bacterium]MCS7324463.1 polyamine aminopropyltransferase [Thermoflexales bacterium]MCX7938398.1 polyamine aminopropyltransferase [Thermoflexales bacterium]MDW8054348.1 polyamine aminopropyltransferase [Anaerolineae bacterium]
MGNIWVTENLYSYFRTSLSVRRILVDERSEYQHIQVLETDFFGRALLLDGNLQLTELDNAGYHEMMVHVPALVVGAPRRALIVGGGDGAALAQMLRYPSLEEIVVCEIDRRVVEVCREHFPAFRAVWDDPRVRLVVRDAYAYMEENPGTFDVICADMTDPLGMSERLFSEDFYRLIVRALAPHGAASAQCDQPYFGDELIRRLYAFARTLVKHPAYYQAFIPSYPGGGNGFLYLSNRPWEEGLNKPYPPGENHYLNPEIHRAAFALPEFLKRKLE